MQGLTVEEEAALLKGVDQGVAEYVRILRAHGVQTFQSCEGGPGHTYPDPTVEFHGDQSEGPRAFGVARSYGLPVERLIRFWDVRDGELCGPYWGLTFKLDAVEFLERQRQVARRWRARKAVAKSKPRR